MGWKSILDLRRYSRTTIAVVGFSAITLIVLTYIVEVRIILESPNYGDVTGVVKSLFRIVSFGIGLVASLSTIYNTFSDKKGSQGLDTGFTIEGGNNDFHFHMGLPESERDDAEQPESNEQE